MPRTFITRNGINNFNVRIKELIPRKCLSSKQKKIKKKTPGRYKTAQLLGQGMFYTDPIKWESDKKIQSTHKSRGNMLKSKVPHEVPKVLVSNELVFSQFKTARFPEKNF